jgi:hypothetical protein
VCRPLSMMRMTHRIMAIWRDADVDVHVYLKMLMLNLKLEVVVLNHDRTWRQQAA